MGQTIAEKILSRVTRDGRIARAGEEVQVKPDFVLAYDFPGYLDLWFRQMTEEFGIERVREPDRFAMFIDHMVPGASPSDERVHQITRDWCRHNGVALYDRIGIGHQVAIELGYAVPGSFSVHFDGHTSQLGAYGALSVGVHKRVLSTLVRDYINFKVPRTTRVNLSGTLQPGVMARDIFHHMVKHFGPAFCRANVLELGGPAIDAMSFDGRQVITCLAMFAGAITAIINPDDAVVRQAAIRSKKNLEPLFSDPDAEYAAVYDLDVSDLGPVVVEPPSPAWTREIEAFAGMRVDVGYIGSCSSGRIEDLRVAADILAGKQVHDGFRLNIVPTSQAIMLQATREGIMETLLKAGAHIVSSTCDLCYGRIATLGDGQRAVSTGTLNTRGRMGSLDSEIYLCSPATVAATALSGTLTDPRRVLPSSRVG